MTSPLLDPLAAAVVTSGGQAATVRVGTVTSITPLQIDMGGTILDPAAVGIARDYAPVVGDVVALLGQSVEGADTSGSTWLAVCAISAGASRMPEVSVLAAKQRTTQFDSPTYTVAAGEQLIGGGINLTVPLKAGHLIGLHVTFHHSNNNGVAATTRVRFRQDSLTGAAVQGKDYVPGPGNLYIGGRLDAWIRPTVTQNQLYVITTQATIIGTGQWGMGTPDIFYAADYGLAANVALV